MWWCFGGVFFLNKKNIIIIIIALQAGKEGNTWHAHHLSTNAHGSCPPNQQQQPAWFLSSVVVCRVEHFC
jgi:hypothetical protein